MGTEKHQYLLQFRAEGGKVVTAELTKMGADGEKSLQKLDVAAARVDSRFGLLTRSVLTRLVPALGVAGLGRFAQRAVGDLGDIADAAQKAGVSAEKLQAFERIGEKLGIGAAAAAEGVAEFVKRVGAAQAGTGKLLPVLEQYNIALKDSEGKNRDANAVMDDYLDLLAATGDAQERLFLASKGFGDGAAALGNGFARGSEGLREFQREGIKTGEIIQNDVIAKADDLDDAYKEVTKRVVNYFKTLTVSILGDFFYLVDAIRGKLGELDAIEARIKELQGRDRSGPGLYNKVEGFFEKGELSQLQRKRAAILAEEPAGPVAPPEAVLARAREIKRLQDSREKNGPPAPARIAAAKAAENRETEKGIDLAEREHEQAEQAIENLKFRNEQMGRSNEEQELYNELKSAGVELETKEGQQIKRLVDEHNRMADAQERNIRAAEAMKRGIDDVITNFDDLRQVGLRALSDLLQGFVDLGGGQKPSASIGGFLAESIFGAFNKPAEQFGPFLPGRASGGPVGAGRDYLVGERGPEILRMGGQGGSVIPNHAMGGTYYIDARGADNEGLARVEQTIRSLNGKIDRVNGSVETRAIAAVQDRQKRSLSYMR